MGCSLPGQAEGCGHFYLSQLRSERSLGNQIRIHHLLFLLFFMFGVPGQLLSEGDGRGWLGVPLA